MHGAGPVPNDQVAPRCGRPDAGHAEQADHHSRFGRDDRLQWVVRAELHRPRGQKIVKRCYQRQQHQERA
jgi:hypothetical protein